MFIGFWKYQKLTPKIKFSEILIFVENFKNISTFRVTEKNIFSRSVFDAPENSFS